MYSIYTGTQAIYAPAGAGSNYLVQNPRYQHEINKAGQLEFTVLPENPVYGKLQRLISPISLYQDGDEIWFGRVYSTDRDFYNLETVTAEGALSFLHDVIIRPFSVTYESGDVVRRYVEYIISQYNKRVEDWKKITVGNVTVTDSNNYLYRYKDSYNDAFDVLMDHTVESSLGGYLSIRRSGGKTYLDYTAEAGGTTDQIIQFGENLLDLSNYVTAENVFTVIIPVGKADGDKKLTIKNVNGGKDYIESAAGVALFGRIEKYVEFPDITTAKALLKAARAALDAGIKQAVSISVKAVDLHLINPNIGGLKHGTMVRVLSHPHGIDEYMLCRKVDINLNEPDDAVYTLGAETATLSGQQAQASKGAVVAVNAADMAQMSAEVTRRMVEEQEGEDEDADTQ